MVSNRARDLVDFLQRRSGDELRSAAYYDADSYELLYHDDAIDRSYSEADLEQIAERMRSEVRRSRAERLFDLGGFDCNVLCFREGLVFHFPMGGERGTVISLEITAARDLHEFIAECNEYVYPDADRA